MGIHESIAIFGDITASDFVRVTHDPADLDHDGWWAITQTFEGEFLAFKFATVTRGLSASQITSRYSGTFDGVAHSDWKSSLNQDDYEAGVRTIHEDIARGWVYQVNLCRVLSAQLPADRQFDPVALYLNLVAKNPAPYAGVLRVYASDSGLDHDVFIVSASPELFISRDHDTLLSRPIKGTAATPDGFLAKDSAENIMIVDLVRNDLSYVCSPGTVNVPVLLAAEEHPGLYHLVSDIEGTLEPKTGWTEIMKALAPAGSISGAPKSSALEVISRLERADRNIYCGAFGWVDADAKQARIAVGIRTFWIDHASQGRSLNFGTGAGITWESEPAAEWAETELKARHLLNVASERYAGNSESDPAEVHDLNRQQESAT